MCAAAVAAVELVGVGEAGDFVGLCGEGRSAEVGVVEGVEGVDAGAPVEGEEGGEEGEGVF